MATGLANHGHIVEIFALHPNYKDLEDKKKSVGSVNVKYVAPMHVRKIYHTKEYYPWFTLIWVGIHATLALAIAALKSKADLIIVGKPHPMNGFAGVLISKIMSCSLIVDCDDYESASGKFQTKFQKNIVAWFENWVPRQAFCVMTNTHFNRNRIVENGVSENRIYYVPNGVDRIRFTSITDEEVIRIKNELSLGPSQVIGYLGSLGTPSHPVSLLIQAFKILQRRLPQAKLLIVGGGEEYQDLLSEIKEQGVLESVRLVGRVPPSQVPVYYKLCDVTVEPIFDDDAAKGRSPLKLFESWISGVPFVTADVGDRRKILGDPLAGLLARPGDSEDLANKLTDLLLNPELAKKIKEQGYARVESYYWEKIAENVNEIISNINRSISNTQSGIYLL
jgi:glycosyltransferase involved in cell wall biosynthesis